MKVGREIKIGALTVVAVFIFVWGLNYLKGRDIFSRQLRFYAIYEDVSGLISSNPVSVNGVNIGQVNRITFMPDGSGRILVENIIDRQLQIPVNSVSMLTGMSLTGSREIVIQLGDATRFIQDGDTLVSGQQVSIQEEVSQMVAPIKQRAEDLFSQIDSVMVVFQAIFSTQTQHNITQSFESIQQTLQNLESTTHKLDKGFEKESGRISNIMANAESISENLKNNNELISNAVANLSSVSDSIAAANIGQTLDNVEKSVESLSLIMEKINQGDGTLGLLVNDKELYHNLESSSKQLELLLEDIRKNPGKYFRISVFGR